MIVLGLTALRHCRSRMKSCIIEPAEGRGSKTALLGDAVYLTN